MGTIASQITSLTTVYWTIYSDADQRKHQSSASLAFVRGIHRGLVNSPHKWPVTRKMFPFDDVIMLSMQLILLICWSPALHWNRNIVILKKFSSLAALEVVILTTTNAGGDENFIKMVTFPFQCCEYYIIGMELLVKIVDSVKWISSVAFMGQDWSRHLHTDSVI